MRILGLWFSTSLCLTLSLTLGLVTLGSIALFAAQRQKERETDVVPEIPGAVTVNNRNYSVYIQISDVHISERDVTILEAFRKFCESIVPTVNPKHVFMSGDLTEAIGKGWGAPSIITSEFRNYSNVLNETGMLDRNFRTLTHGVNITSSLTNETVWVPEQLSPFFLNASQYNVSLRALLRSAYESAEPMWLDIRGNHDRFDVSSQNNSRKDHYIRFGTMGRKLISDRYYSVGLPPPGTSSASSTAPAASPSVLTLANVSLPSFLQTASAAAGGLSFFVFDATPKAGLTLNVFGRVTNVIEEGFRAHLARARAASLKTVLVGHYSSGQLERRNLLFDQAIKGAGVLAYLCGHFHLRNMISRQKRSLLELELADFKHKRTFRVLAYDQGLLSFADAEFTGEVAKDFPLVVLTSPKDARYLTREENLVGLRKTTTIRALVFAPAAVMNITKVAAFIDDSASEFCILRPVAPGDPMHECDWGPVASLLFGSGIHTIKIVVSTTDMTTGGNFARTIGPLPFSLDGTTPKLGLNRNQYISHVHLPSLFQGLFVSMYLFIASTMVFGPRIFMHVSKQRGEWSSFEERVMNMLEEEDRGFSSREIHHWRVPLLDLLTWQVKVAVWKYGTMPLVIWLPMATFYLNLGIGLWYCGVLINDFWGFVFAWGFFHRMERVPTADMAVLGCVLLLFIYLPPIIVLGRVSLGLHGAYHRKGNDPWIHCRHTLLGPFAYFLIVLHVIASLLLNILIALTMGLVALVFSPAVLWWPVTSVALFWKALAFNKMYAAEAEAAVHPEALDGPEDAVIRRKRRGSFVPLGDDESSVGDSLIRSRDARSQREDDSHTHNSANPTNIIVTNTNTNPNTQPTAVNSGRDKAKSNAKSNVKSKAKNDASLKPLPPLKEPKPLVPPKKSKPPPPLLPAGEPNHQ